MMFEKIRSSPLAAAINSVVVSSKACLVDVTLLAVVWIKTQGWVNAGRPLVSSNKEDEPILIRIAVKNICVIVFKVQH